MDPLFALEQSLNGLQFGLMLFLLAAGLTLVFGIMDMINLAHGSLYMIGAYLTATIAYVTGSFLLAVPLALIATACFAMVLELAVLRHLYQRDHLAQVLATFALILILNELTRLIWGVHPLMFNLPESLSGSVEIVPGMSYPVFRLLIIAVGLAVAVFLYVLIACTRTGMLIRAGASNRLMATVMGVNINRLFTAVFGLGAALCALAGGMLGSLLSVQVGMGESILILALVVVVIGGIGSIRGALIGAILVGLVDTFGRAALPQLLRIVLPASVADVTGPSLASISIYLLMAVVLFWKPQGLFPARG